MSTSAAPCELCGETPDGSGRIDAGCVACNPDKERLAYLPEVPVTPGPDGERIGCIQHHEVDCERCGLLETRHRLAFDPHQQDETGSWFRQERMSPAYLPVIVLFCALAVLVCVCFWYVWTHLPR